MGTKKTSFKDLLKQGGPLNPAKGPGVSEANDRLEAYRQLQSRQPAKRPRAPTAGASRTKKAPRAEEASAPVEGQRVAEGSLDVPSVASGAPAGDAPAPVPQGFFDNPALDPHNKDREEAASTVKEETLRKELLAFEAEVIAPAEAAGDEELEEEAEAIHDELELELEQQALATHVAQLRQEAMAMRTTAQHTARAPAGESRRPALGEGEDDVEDEDEDGDLEDLTAAWRQRKLA